MNLNASEKVGDEGDEQIVLMKNINKKITIRFEAKKEKKIC